MARTVAYRNAATNAVGSAVTSYVALHTASPAGGVVGELTGGGYVRVPVVFPASSSGSSAQSVTVNVPAGVTVTHWSRQTASTGSTSYEDGALSSSAVFSSAGTLTLTLTINTPA